MSQEHINKMLQETADNILKTISKRDDFRLLTERGKSDVALYIIEGLSNYVLSVSIEERFMSHLPKPKEEKIEPKSEQF